MATAQHRGVIPKIQMGQSGALVAHSGGAAANSSRRGGPIKILSSTRTSYTLTPRGTGDGGTVADASRLTPRDMRSIANYVSFNVGLRHQHRARRIETLIPPCSFTKAEDTHDMTLGLSIAGVNPQESALDVPLRLAAPESFHCPVITEPRSTTVLSARLITVLKRTSAMPQHWTGEKEGREKDVAHINILKDYEIRAKASKRAQKALPEALAHFSLGSLHFSAGTLERAISSFTAACSLFDQEGHMQGAALCHNLLGVSYYKIGEYKMALVHHAKQEVQSAAYGRAVAQINMGVCYAALNELHFAEQAFSDALTNAVDANDSVLEAIALGNVGIANMRLGDMKRAQSHVEQCLERCSVAGDKIGAAVCLLLLGEIYNGIADYPHAQFYYEHAFRVASEARCSDVAEMARVSIGAARGNQAIRQTVMHAAQKMGQQFSMRDVMMCLPKNA